MADVKKVLIVEDEESIRKALEKALISVGGIEVIEAEDGHQALELIAQQRPDLILLDVIMPKMHGIDMLSILHNDEQNKSIPVILLTNYADDPKVIAAVDAGFCELMDKTKCKLTEVVDRVKVKLELT